jgi:hypothetical protein
MALIAAYQCMDALQGKSILLMDFGDVLHQPGIVIMTSGTVKANALVMHVSMTTITIALCL